MSLDRDSLICYMWIQPFDEVALRANLQLRKLNSKFEKSLGLTESAIQGFSKSLITILPLDYGNSKRQIQYGGSKFDKSLDFA